MHQRKHPPPSCTRLNMANQVAVYNSEWHDELVADMNAEAELQSFQTTSTRKQRSFQRTIPRSAGSSIAHQKSHTWNRGLGSSTRDKFGRTYNATMKKKAGGTHGARARNAKTLKREGKLRMEKYWEETERKKAENMASLQRVVDRNRAREQQRFENLLNNMDEENKFVQEMSDMLKLKEHTEKRKQEQLYKAWNHKVFKPIIHQIQRQLDTVSTSQLERNRNELYENYLQAVNKKGGVFRDIIIDDYDPLAARKRTLKYDASRINKSDPVKKDLMKYSKEKEESSHILATHDTIKPTNRPVLALTQWDKLEATPHGRYSKMFAKQAQNRGLGEQKKEEQLKSRNKSTMVLDHYNVQTGPMVVKQQYFPNGKIVFPGKRRNRNIITHNLDKHTVKV